MKKNYSKPEIVFESFKMSSSIADSCNEKVITDTMTCFIEMDFGEKLFAEGGVCDMYDPNCYQVPQSNPNIFGS